MAVFPADDAHAAAVAHLAGARRVLTFGSKAPAGVTGEAHWDTDALGC